MAAEILPTVLLYCKSTLISGCRLLIKEGFPAGLFNRSGFNSVYMALRMPPMTSFMVKRVDGSREVVTLPRIRKYKKALWELLYILTTRILHYSTARCMRVGSDRESLGAAVAGSYLYKCDLTDGYLKSHTHSGKHTCAKFGVHTGVWNLRSRFMFTDLSLDTGIH